MSITDVTIFDNLNNFKDLSETFMELAYLKKKSSYNVKLTAYRSRDLPLEPLIQTLWINEKESQLRAINRIMSGLEQERGENKATSRSTIISLFSHQFSMRKATRLKTALFYISRWRKGGLSDLVTLFSGIPFL